MSTVAAGSARRRFGTSFVVLWWSTILKLTHHGLMILVALYNESVVGTCIVEVGGVPNHHVHGVTIVIVEKGYTIVWRWIVLNICETMYAS